MAVITQVGKPELLIKISGVAANGIYNHGIDCDLVTDGQGSLNGIYQQHFANSVSTGIFADGQSSNQSSRNRMLWQLSGQLFRQLAQFNG